VFVCVQEHVESSLLLSFIFFSFYFFLIFNIHCGQMIRMEWELRNQQKGKFSLKKKKKGKFLGSNSFIFYSSSQNRTIDKFGD